MAHEQTPTPTPKFLDPSDARVIAAAFVAGGYTEARARERLGVESLLDLRGQTLRELLARTAEPDALSLLLRLFVLCVPVPPEMLASHLGQAFCDSAADSGLIVPEQVGPAWFVRSPVLILPIRGLWIASDRPKVEGQRRPADYVMGIGTSTRTLDNLTIRRPIDREGPLGRVLDLGTGCGYHALLAASHAREVVGTDLNPRAIEFARLNAALNSITNVTWRVGSFYEPVEHERFDLIISNPPFVIAPETAHIYRSAGQAGDQTVEVVVRGAAARLAEGGVAQFLCNWAHVRGQLWQSRLSAWAEGLGCDLLVLRSETLEAGDYAAYWVEHTCDESDDPSPERVARWREAYDALGIEAVSVGMILLRARRAKEAGANGGVPNWASFDDAPKSMLGAAGAAVATRIDAETRLRSMDDGALLRARVRIASHARLRQTLRPVEGGWGLEGASVALVEGLAYEMEIDAELAQLLIASSGEGVVVGSMMEVNGVSGAGAGHDQSARLTQVRALIARGVLGLA